MFKHSTLLYYLSMHIFMTWVFFFDINNDWHYYTQDGKVDLKQYSLIPSFVFGLQMIWCQFPLTRIEYTKVKLTCLVCRVAMHYPRTSVIRNTWSGAEEVKIIQIEFSCLNYLSKATESLCQYFISCYTGLMDCQIDGNITTAETHVTLKCCIMTSERRLKWPAWWFIMPNTAPPFARVINTWSKHTTSGLRVFRVQRSLHWQNY